MNYIKFEIFLDKDDILFFENLNCFFFDLEIGSIEIMVVNNVERYFFYIPCDKKDEILNKIRDFFKFNQKKLKLKEIEKIDESYLFKWKESYKPVIIDNIVVKPSWEDIVYKNKIVVELDPQAAFGTGQHESTKLAIKALNLIKSNSENSLIDIGTGSGILSIVAYKLGIKNIVSIDIDFDALKIARGNFFKNNFKNFSIICGSADAIGNKKNFNIVIANIISSVLLEIRDSLKNIVKERGFLILSGILTEELENFKSQFDFNGFFLKHELYLNEWVSLIFEKRGEV